LPPKERLAIYDDMKIQGWCVDWIKELFEDAFSVLAFRFTFIEYFDDILGRRGGRDDRHPSKEIRIAVARELLKLAGFQTPDGFQPKDEHEPQPDLSEEKRKEWKNKKAREEKIIKAVAKQIFSFVSLALAAWRYDAEASTNIKDQIYVQKKYPPNYLRESLDGLESWISGRITEWSTWINSVLPKGNSKGLTKEEMATFLMLNVEEFIGLIRMNAEPVPQRDLLKGKNYQQLLALSFFDVDYHAPGDIQLSEGGTHYWVKPTDWDSTAWSAQRKPHSAGKPVLLGHTIIMKVSDNSQWSVNKSDWNSWFKMTQ
ncbi:MAG: hypothetical protein HGA28_07670, partial [Anaerolineaceae bacterium]|nr:hypothetical protein [Anaerolineaceae bacterium]